MRRSTPRQLRRLLLGIFALVVVAVAWSLLRPRGPAERSGSETGLGAGTIIQNLDLDIFREGERRIELKARAKTGEEGNRQFFEGVEVTFPYVGRGEESTATITADEAVYNAKRERARFRGNVHVVTADGLELTTESLDYLGREGRVVTEAALQFRQGTTSGRAQGAEYRARSDSIVLQKEVRLRFEDQSGGAPTEIDAARAHGSRKTRVFNFGGGVEVRQGPRVLRSRRLQVIINAELDGIERAAAIEDVDLLLRGGEAMPGARLPSGGERRLQCRRLNVGFWSGGLLKDATASNNASLVLEPGPGEAPQRRRLEARRIRFGFDEQGRLVAVRAQDTGVSSAKGTGVVVMSSTPVPPARGPGKEVRCLSLRASVDPDSGDVRSAVFERRVVFSEAGRQGWARRADYDGASGRVRMSGGGPRIRDDADGSELQAERIDVGTTTRGLVAVGGVRHAIGRGGAGGGMLDGPEPAVVVCRRFEYDEAKKTAWYRDNALLRAGGDEIRAPVIALEDRAPGVRTLRANGGVVSFLRGRSRSAEEQEEPAGVETRSKEMVYEEKEGRVVYTGDVQIRQGDILTLSPTAVVTLSATGDDVSKIVAGEPVEVHQGARHARGRTGTYTPADETLVLEGEEVVLQESGREVRGRALTFEVGADRIRVDGREEVRTEAIFDSKEPSRP